MRFNSLIIIIVALLFGQLSSLADFDARKVENNILSSAEQPRLAIGVDERFEYAGVHDFDIRGIAGGTRHVWVETDGVKVRRMFIVQLEGFYEGTGGVYRYDLSTSPKVAGYRWRSNGWAFDLTQTRLESPGNESSVTANFLEQSGYKLPEILLMWRSLTVVNESRSHEAIIFLMESADQHGIGLNDLFQGDEDTPLWKKMQKRMERDFQVLLQLAPVDEAGNPILPWQHILAKSGSSH